MLSTISLWRFTSGNSGFEPLYTPAFEYTDTLGKFRDTTGRREKACSRFRTVGRAVGFAALRHAPLCGGKFDALPKPFRRYQSGYVYRNEKLGPGRFRQFMQFDADTVGTPRTQPPTLAADALEALGIPRGATALKLSSRTLLDFVLDAAEVNCRA